MDVPAQFSAILPASPSEVNHWFAAEIKPHEHSLRAYLRARFPALHDTDDVIQETYIRMLRTRDTGEIRSPKALLFTTARNLAISHFRIETTHPTDRLANFEHIAVLQEEIPLTAHLTREVNLQLLESAIQALPAKCREVILLKKIQNFSYDQISTRLGITHNTISAHLTYGVTKIRDYLRAHGASFPK